MKLYLRSLAILPMLPLLISAQAVKVGKLPHLEFDTKTKQIRIDAEMLGVELPLEFFAVMFNGPEHEAVIRSKVKPSDLHTALLAVGLKPGAPVSWSKAANKWLPPHGPPVQIQMEYEKDGKKITEPATRWMRNVKTKKEMPATTWIFAGSRVMNDGNYAADSTGYLVSIVNFDMTVIDIPSLASSSNETLEWERNPETAPPPGTKVVMVIEPAAGSATQPATKPATQPADRLSDVTLDESVIDRATQKWNALVKPKSAMLREAAQAHFDAVSALRKEQQRLVDEADRIQRVIDGLERQYQDLTTLQPEFRPEPADSIEPSEGAAPTAP